ncbi:hypothetical protein ACW9H6_01015 [Pseudomonas sp. SDO528_S397]
MIIGVYLIISAFGIIVSFTAKVLLSGRTMGNTRYFIGYAISGCFLWIHGELIFYDKFPFYGRHPELIKQYEIIGWFALSCYPIQALAFPAPYEVRWLFSKRLEKQ